MISLGPTITANRRLIIRFFLVEDEFFIFRLVRVFLFYFLIFYAFCSISSDQVVTLFVQFFLIEGAVDLGVGAEVLGDQARGPGPERAGAEGFREGAQVLGGRPRALALHLHQREGPPPNHRHRHPRILGQTRLRQGPSQLQPQEGLHFRDRLPRQKDLPGTPYIILQK